MLGFTTLSEAPLSQASITIDVSAFMSGTSGSVELGLLSYQALANITFPATTAQFFVNLDDPDTVRFPYQDFADDYYRGRTLFIAGFDRNNTVHVVEESRTTFVTQHSNNNVVHILPENRTVVIEKQQGSNTVHIAA